ncbi:MAG: thioesterase family protein [Hyphomicrobiaceae bacterium]|nr:thioesterase family protein [Hyphomicrobiaceae bacterium]
MNLWFRLLWYILSVRWRPRIEMPDGISRLTFRVWPHDLDTSLHLNNGRYLTLMDVGRLDVMVASGLWRAVLRHRWTPVASAIKIRYRREIRAFERFELETRLVTWSDLTVVMEQRFVFKDGDKAGQLAAHALFKGGLYDRAARRFVPIDRLMAETGITAEAPPATSEVTAFLKADRALKDAVRRDD